MSETISSTSWVYAIIQNPGGLEQLVGYKDENEIQYIPTLKSKEDAENFLSYMKREPGIKYEAQAIIYEDILNYASENSFLIFFVDKEGNIKEKIDPNTILNQ